MKFTDNYKVVSAQEVEGKTIHSVFDTENGWREYKSKTKVPPGSKLFNFDLKVGSRVFLVLDDYGNELLDQGMHEYLFGKGVINLAIDKETGIVYVLDFGKDSGKYVACFREFPNDGEYPPAVPHTYLKRLDELKSAKRPFAISFSESALLAYVSREEGRRHLQNRMVIKLYFHPLTLELSEEDYREVGEWKDVDE